MPAQNTAKPDVPSELEICVRPDVQSHGLLCFFNIFQRSTTTLSVLGAPKAKPIQAGFLVECKVPAKVTAPVAKRYVKQHATALFKATSFRLKGLHVRPVQSQSAKERSVILSNIPFMYLIEYPSRQ